MNNVSMAGLTGAAFLVFAISIYTFAHASNKPCFCMKKLKSDDFLWGCEQFLPPNAATPEAICRHPTTGQKGLPFKIEDPWVKVAAGQENCSPCRRQASSIDLKRQIPRGSEDKRTNDTQSTD